MKKQTKTLLTLMLLVVFVATMLSACALGDFGESDTTDANLYATYKAVVSAKGYVLVSQEEFTKLLDTVRSDGLTILSLNAPKLSDVPGDSTKQQWVLEFVMSDGSTKTTVLPATKIDSGDNPQPANDGKTIDTAYTVAEVLTAFASLGVDEFSSKAVYVTGTIQQLYIYTEEGYEDCTIINLANADETAFLYIEYVDTTDFPDIAEGDQIIIYGYITNYSDGENPAELIMSYYTVNEGTDDEDYIDPVIVSASSGGSDEPDPSGHNFPSYFTYDKCTDEGCNVIGRKTADGTFANKFKYTLTESDVDGYIAAYDWLAENVNKSNVNVNTFYDKFDELALGLDNVYCQNQIAEVLSYVSGNYGDYDTSNEYYNNLNDKYMSLIATILNGSNSSLKEQLKKHAQTWEIELAQSTSGVEGVADINNEINNILSEYNTAQSQGADTATFETLYQRLVTQNNLLAQKYGYEANEFMKYSYANDYGRDYTPEHTQKMSAYVLQYIKPLYETISQKLDTKSTALQNNGTDADWSLVEGLLSDNLFAKQSSSSFNDVKAAIQSIADYFDYLDSNNSGATFGKAVEDLFKTGNYFKGSTEGAFTYYIYEVEKPILYFSTQNYANIGESDNYYYASGFTFVHEFGHYYESIKNNANISMDFCETQSQGNEMLFLAWLANNNNATIGYEALKYNQLANILETVLSATAVDEFEQAAYSGKYNGKDVNANNYQDIYDEICEKYGISQGAGKNDYWYRVCFDSAAYYISYSMSALPSIEIYAKAVAATDGGLDVAKNAYLTLFKTDSTDYNVMLEKAGLHNAFEEDLYKYLTANIK